MDTIASHCTDFEPAVSCLDHKKMYGKTENQTVPTCANSGGASSLKSGLRSDHWGACCTMSASVTQGAYVCCSWISKEWAAASAAAQAEAEQ
jgi:hypothetical protein